MYPYHVNDPEFADALVDSFLEISLKNPTDSSPSHVAVDEPSQDHSISTVKPSSSGTICYSPSNCPDARPGTMDFFIMITS